MHLSDVCMQNKVFQLVCHDSLIKSSFLGICLIPGSRVSSEMAAYPFFFLVTFAFVIV